MKFKTKGWSIKIGTSAVPTTPITQLGDGTLDLGERDALINATTHDTSTGTHEQLDPGFKSTPSLTGEYLYDPADAVHEVIRAAHAAGTTLYVICGLPNTTASTFSFTVRVKSLSLPFPVMGKLAINYSFEGLAAETFAAGA